MRIWRLRSFSLEHRDQSTLLANNQGAALVTVVILSALIMSGVLMLISQAKLFIDRRAARNLRILRDYEFTSEMKFVIAQPNCGIEDLSSGSSLSPSGGGTFSLSKTIYPILLGITAPSLGATNSVLKVGSQYLSLKINSIAIGPFNPKLYKEMYDPSSSEGQAFKSINGMSVGYVAKGVENNYLASLSVGVSSKYNQSSTPMIATFPVLVKVQNSKIVSCQSLGFHASTMSICEQLSGNFDEENMSCDLPATTSPGSGMICPVNNSCGADNQYVM